MQVPAELPPIASPKSAAHNEPPSPPATLAPRFFRSRWSIPLVWLLVGETLYDTVTNVSGGIREHLFGAASGVTWLVVSFYVPLLMVCVGLTVWQLYTRRGEPLERSGADKPWVSNLVSMAR